MKNVSRSVFACSINYEFGLLSIRYSPIDQLHVSQVDVRQTYTSVAGLGQTIFPQT